MTKFWTTILGGLIIILVISGLFDKISWAFNIPAIIIVALVWVVSIYNGFVQLRYRVKEALSDIDVQLKRRYDLIPNVVETVKGYAKHESQVFENVTKARTEAMGAKGLAEKAEKENMLSNTLKTLFAVSESYPDLKANANFLDLQRELADTENKIQASRRFYNGNIMALNTAMDTFPSNIIAGLFHFSHEDFFDLPDGSPEAEPVKVSF
ncbi:MAG: LemA family protein [Parcubacteria group bacterium GW2011_GWA2_46_9]|nr:MAG: LemA family protein [Parcubacteria group bacterium GW2011_GWA2_46_9]